MPTIPIIAARQPATTTRTLLKIVRAAQPVSRAELARRLSVNRSTVTEIVRPLLDSNVLREGATLAPKNVPGTPHVGRPPIALSLNADTDYFIGVNVGVRQTQVGAVTLDGKIIDREIFDTPDASAVAFKEVAASINRVRDKAREQTLAVVGVSVPSPVDEARRQLLYAPHLDWKNVDVAAALETSLSNTRTNGKNSGDAKQSIPVVVENDATAAAIYEARRRLAHKEISASDDFILVRVGTGIGVGLVLNGSVYRGGVGTGVTGEFGHMTIVAGGKPCVCGNRGCWERYASATNAATLYSGDRSSTTTATGALRFQDVVARAEAGDRRARATLEQVGNYLGIGIANVISGLGVTRVVVSGRIVYGWEFIHESLHDALGRSMVGRLTNWSVEAGEPTGAGLGGALEVAIDEHLARLAP